MTDLRQAAMQALEALESSRIFVTTREKTKHPEGTEWYDSATADLRTALEQPEQEPVAWQYKTAEAGIFVSDQLPQDVQVWQEVEWSKPLYTTPPAPKREWQGLTDDEILEAAQIDGADTWLFATAYAIEAKLKEKNT
jgi:hypothetical protein